MSYRKNIIRLFTFLGGIYFFLLFILPERIGRVTFSAYKEEITDGFRLIGAMALGLGLINLLMVHGSKLVLRRKGWQFSSVLLFGLFTMLAITGADWASGAAIGRRAGRPAVLRDFALRIEQDYKEGKLTAKPWNERNQALVNAVVRQVAEMKDIAKPAATGEANRSKELQAALEDLNKALAGIESILPAIPVSETSAPDFGPNRQLAAQLSAASSAARGALGAEYHFSLTKKLFNFLTQGFFTALGAAMFSLLGFYMAAAAYRAFRIRSAESGLMLGAALLVMLGQIPFGVWFWEDFPSLRLWLLQVPSAAAERAIQIGAAVAGLVMAFRMWLSIESEKFE